MSTQPSQQIDLVANKFSRYAMATWLSIGTSLHESANHRARHDETQIAIGPPVDGVLRLPDGRSLSLAFPNQSVSDFVGALGQRIIFWPGGIEQRRRLSIVSSRLKQQLDLHPLWFGALRTQVMRMTDSAECLCVVDGTTAAESVTRAAELFGQSILRLSICDEIVHSESELTDWMISSLTRPDTDVREGEMLAIVSPEYRFRDLVADNSPTRPPITDALLVSGGQNIVALSCRSGGHTQVLLQQRLQASDSAPVLVVSHPESIKKSTEDSLTHCGAVRWLLDDAAAEHDASSARKTSLTDLPSEPANDFFATLEADEWLSHWTRRRPGPWPDETRSDYLDSLILGCESADHSAFATLLRIVETQIIFPSRLSKGSVSFTAVPLSEFRQRRVYRRHLRRYDFEPWGLAIRKGALTAMGARPVEYQSQSHSPKTEQRHWHQQPASDQAGRIDWTAELEWRKFGSLNLGELTPKDVFVFVNTDAERRFLQARSGWLVVRLPDVAAGKSLPDA